MFGMMVAAALINVMIGVAVAAEAHGVPKQITVEDVQRVTANLMTVIPIVRMDAILRQHMRCHVETLQEPFADKADKIIKIEYCIFRWIKNLVQSWELCTRL